MCPGCSTTLGTPPATVSRCSSASIATLPVPYSPYAVRGSSSVTGTRATGPWTQMLPQCRSSGRVGRSASTSWLRRLGREAEHVDDGVRRQRGDPLAERPGGVLGLAVGGDPLDRPPLRRRHVRLALAAAERHDLMAGSDQARDQVGPDVAGGPDDDDAAHRTSLATAKGS